MADPPSVSNIKSDETILFFHSVASYDESIDSWRIPIHGWVFEEEQSRFRRTALKKILEKTLGLEMNPDQLKRFNHRITQFLVDNERSKTVVIELMEKRYILAKSRANGHFGDEIVIPAGDLANFDITTGKLTYKTILRNTDPRKFTGTVSFHVPDALVVISDIDDTIKVSEVSDKRKLLGNTFCNEFEAAPGMAEFYTKLGENAPVSFNYVSSSPWHLYPALKAFTDASNFPEAVYHLKYFRIKDRTLFNIFKKGTETKPIEIEKILGHHPGSRFLLIGDSGEEDPEVYGEIYRRFGARIQAILIRNVTGSGRDNQRFTEAFRHVPDAVWQLFRHPDEIKLSAVLLRQSEDALTSSTKPAMRPASNAENSDE